MSNAIEFDLSVDDLVAFHLRFMQTSDIGRHQLRRFRLLSSLLVLLVSFVMVGYVFGHPIGGAIYAIMVAIALWFAAPRLWFAHIKRTIRRMAASDGIGTTGWHRLTVDDAGITEETAHGQTFAAWSGLKRIDQAEQAAYVFFAPNQAFIIPKRFGETRFMEFVQVIKDRCMHCQ